MLENKKGFVRSLSAVAVVLSLSVATLTSCGGTMNNNVTEKGTQTPSEVVSDVVSDITPEKNVENDPSGRTADNKTDTGIREIMPDMGGQSNSHRIGK